MVLWWFVWWFYFVISHLKLDDSMMICHGMFMGYSRDINRVQPTTIKKMMINQCMEWGSTWPRGIFSFQVGWNQPEVVEPVEAVRFHEFFKLFVFPQWTEDWTLGPYIGSKLSNFSLTQTLAWTRKQLVTCWGFLPPNNSSKGFHLILDGAAGLRYDIVWECMGDIVWQPTTIVALQPGASKAHILACVRVTTWVKINNHIVSRYAENKRQVLDYNLCITLQCMNNKLQRETNNHDTKLH